MLTRDEICKAVVNVAQKHAIEKIFLFGSYARGDATEKSDCDLRIVGGNIHDLLDIAQVMVDLEEVLGKEIDLILTDSIVDEVFFISIQEDEVLVYG